MNGDFAKLLPDTSSSHLDNLPFHGAASATRQVLEHNSSKGSLKDPSIPSKHPYSSIWKPERHLELLTPELLEFEHYKSAHALMLWQYAKYHIGDIRLSHIGFPTPKFDLFGCMQCIGEKTKLDHELTLEKSLPVTMMGMRRT